MYEYVAMDKLIEILKFFGILILIIIPVVVFWYILSMYMITIKLFDFFIGIFS